MSTVISFRLDKANPREAEALLVLSQWQEEGYSIRYILTEALIRLDSAENNSNADLADILNALQTISQQIQELESRPSHPLKNQVEPQAVLSGAFLLAVKGAAKPGVRMDG